jgi:hypothetical protein
MVTAAKELLAKGKAVASPQIKLTFFWRLQGASAKSGLKSKLVICDRGYSKVVNPPCPPPIYKILSK